jgi:hypothetical protein
MQRRDSFDTHVCSFEVFMGVDVMSRPNENKPRASAPSTGWKFLAKDTCHFMLLDVTGVVNDSVNARMRHILSRFEYIADACHE